MIVIFFYRLKNKVIEFCIPLFFKCLYGRRFRSCGKIRLQKGSEIILEGKKSYCTFKGNFSTRKYFLLRVCDSAECMIGNNVFFNNFCSVTCMKKIEIGDDCIFGENVKIYDHNHNYKDNQNLIRNQGCSSDTVIIGKNCWIGSNVVILKGVHIGNNCVIGANSVVYRDLPSESVYLNDGRIINKKND